MDIIPKSGNKTYYSENAKYHCKNLCLPRIGKENINHLFHFFDKLLFHGFNPPFQTDNWRNNRTFRKLLLPIPEQSFWLSRCKDLSYLPAVRFRLRPQINGLQYPFSIPFFRSPRNGRLLHLLSISYCFIFMVITLHARNVCRFFPQISVRIHTGLNTHRRRNIYNRRR